uniref:Uncharacterized protein n=1 Tax=Ananas comosus var. bracteatus TaxID=296719 RepID=A0A6V7PE58_ANACO|nr:unnamed protein product [Ananas comosus var. bracteatus]
MEKGKEKVIHRPAEKKAGNKIGDRSSSTHSRKAAPPRGLYAPSTSSCPLVPGAAASRQEMRALRPCPNQVFGVIEATYPCKHGSDDRSTSKKVLWADAAGCALTQTAFFHPEDPTLAPSSLTPCKPPLFDTSTPINKRRHHWKTAPSSQKTYKEALLTPSSSPPRQPRLPTIYSPSLPPSLGSLSFIGRCFQSLGRTHRAARCRDPISRRTAPARLGHFPQETIANGLVRRFGRFPSDFHARYSERDFVIFLPEWVPSDELLHRKVISLDDLRLRCFRWDLHFGASRPPLTYNVWIRLVSLPYECWSSRTVAALVGDFGRFIRADDFSVRMVDLTSNRCLISVNHLHDIPENLEITFGDLLRSVLIQLERWARREDDGHGIPPTRDDGLINPRIFASHPTTPGEATHDLSGDHRSGLRLGHVLLDLGGSPGLYWTTPSLGHAPRAQHDSGFCISWAGRLRSTYVCCGDHHPTTLPLLAADSTSFPPSDTREPPGSSVRLLNACEAPMYAAETITPTALPLLATDSISFPTSDTKEPSRSSA